MGVRNLGGVELEGLHGDGTGTKGWRRRRKRRNIVKRVVGEEQGVGRRRVLGRKCEEWRIATCVVFVALFFVLSVAFGWRHGQS